MLWVLNPLFLGHILMQQFCSKFPTWPADLAGKVVQLFSHLYGYHNSWNIGSVYEHQTG